ncbi:NADH:ubiquinone oxidoreductase [Vibrio aestuarianus]|uniref:NADH:ubiquinone oxidoreductase n=1 Tax=Vibrio aestuarianus TaxID=28171 RepID=A0A7X6N922_9VIBR|nr:NADH:ubiquinone oxidoreductase [Vibrio aestuarianus]MDE1209747.1 NADH:ubiquinone oxidoreductase [Vibrio aestuarianus]MDE1224382.1 NADH:ubiquinone oxidoreductase [Vibrio aestuarianus]MDE1231264.1 NADH:ubiquinone oxidoreductase [Vibrio aestuarianus]MDE1241197.1 NADH:ubiquinone oxidoreductase [Vibrio aestuarianus]MDE1251410.1 NADH:ubiquinone oxidoreductase [Vibrio aestuarianus]
MKLILILIASVSAGVASAEHFHSFLLGLYVSSLAVGTCYWFAFRSTRVPEFALFLLICGLFAKLSVTVVGVMWGVSADLITSPIVFALSYMFFSIVVTYIWFSYRDKKTPTPKLSTQV